MKFHQTEFAHQLFAVMTGSLLLVACVAFATLPAVLANDWPAMAWHLT